MASSPPHRDPVYLDNWIDRVEPIVTKQLRARPYYPCDTTEIEALLARVRAWFEDRAFALRNRDRANLLLRLMTNELAGLADEKTYAQRIRAALNQLGLARRHAIYDSPRLHGKPPVRRTGPSLGIPAAPGPHSIAPMLFPSPP